MAALTVSVSAFTLSRTESFHIRSEYQRRRNICHGLQSTPFLRGLAMQHQLKLSTKNHGLFPSKQDRICSRRRFEAKKFGGCGAVSPQASAESETEEKEKIPFGSTRKDVLLVGLGITVFGFALKYGLQLAGLDPLRAGNVVQITLVLGLMLGWLSTYLFRVGGKQMTYVQQLKDYEDAVMKKRLEEMPEAELESMLAEIEEEKRRLKEKRNS